MAKGALKRLAWIADSCGAVSASYSVLMHRRLDLVLSLHRVSPDATHVQEAIHPRDLDEFLSFLQKHFLVSSLDGLREGEASRRPRVALTFDDGYGDFLEHAMPVLYKHRVRANLNVIVECVQTGRPMWNVRLYDFFTHAPLSLLRELSWEGRPEIGDDLKSRRRLARSLVGGLKWLSEHERAARLRGMLGVIGRADLPATKMLGTKEVVEIARAHDVGCHSLRHASFHAESDASFQEDFRGCQEFFRSLSLPLEVYAFPNGSFRASQVSWLLEQGVKNVLLVEEALNERVPGRKIFSRVTGYGENLSLLKINLLRRGLGKPFSALPTSSGAPGPDGP